MGLATKLSLIPSRNLVLGRPLVGIMLGVATATKGMKVRASSVERVTKMVEGPPLGGKETTAT